MAAETLARAGFAATIYDRMPSVGRKFLLAGRGGLNLTHGEPFGRFLSRYGEASGLLASAIERFSPDDLRAWCRDLGEPTVVGSSGRVFPRSFKASPLLRAWLGRLGALGVTIRLRHRWTGFGDDGALLFAGPDGAAFTVRPSAAILALGGASWPRLGSDGSWVAPMRAAGIAVADLAPSNCGFLAPWSSVFRERFAGEPLKRIALSFEGRTVRGEALVTAAGIEGGAVYALSGPLRDEISSRRVAVPTLDLRPDLAEADLARLLARRRPKDTLSSVLRRAGLPPVAAGLMREAAGHALAGDPAALARLAKATPLPLLAPTSIERAISCAGGVRFAELDRDLMVKSRPGLFVAGEMLDWEAPTGGYLLQACFATGVAAADGARRWLTARD
jgi:uncharacterized flavoprotein (TIGR03862 family)